ncbi:protein Brevis radix-like 1 [Cryptomeria japonica]|uniref:protein Brevis radix-like 1 n=1 Tax=Cryptomeria japonica TaxID=3369 RepID=UPI0027D9FC30|nr:protein Brevis radix-like 1 [Cryptomeria japonica]
MERIRMKLFSFVLNCFASAHRYEEFNRIEEEDFEQGVGIEGGGGEEESTEDFEQGVHITVQEEEEENIEDFEQGVRIEEGGGGEESTEDFEQGVHITVQRLAGGSRQVKRIKFSREFFSEMQARLWWKENWVRVRDHYASIGK